MAMFSTSVLTASLLLGQGFDPAPGIQQGVQQRGLLQQESRPLFSRLRNFFNRNADQPKVMPNRNNYVPPSTVEPPLGGVPSAAPLPINPAPIDFPQKLPANAPPINNPPATPKAIPAPLPLPTPTPPPPGGLSQQTSPKTIQPAMLQQPAKTAAKSPLSSANANKVGRDEKFTWITGQLEFEAGQPVIYYATPDTVDPHHGRLPIQTNVDLTKFRAGDLVCLHGQVANRAGSAVYRATNVDSLANVPAKR